MAFNGVDSYLTVKRRRLQEQYRGLPVQLRVDDNKAGERTDTSLYDVLVDAEHKEINLELFKGIRIFVNGLTNPTLHEIRMLVAPRGGQVELGMATGVTHIIASTLPSTKIKALQKMRHPPPIIRGSWILDCIAANTILDTRKYQLDILGERDTITLENTLVRATPPFGTDPSSSSMTDDPVTRDPLKWQKTTPTLTSEPSRDNLNLTSSSSSLLVSHQSVSLMPRNRYTQGTQSMAFTPPSMSLRPPQRNTGFSLSPWGSSLLQICHSSHSRSILSSASTVIPSTLPSSHLNSAKPKDRNIWDTIVSADVADALRRDLVYQAPSAGNVTIDVHATLLSKIEGDRSRIHEYFSRSRLHLIGSWKDDHCNALLWPALRKAVNTVKVCRAANEGGISSQSQSTTACSVPMFPVPSSFATIIDTILTAHPTPLSAHLLIPSSQHPLQQISSCSITSLSTSSTSPCASSSSSTSSRSSFLSSFPSPSLNTSLGVFQSSMPSPVDPHHHDLVFHIDMDSFFVSASLLLYPSLDHSSPIAITHHAVPQGASSSRLSPPPPPLPPVSAPSLQAKSTSSISSCNKTARRFGVRADIFVQSALKLCPNLVLLPYNFALYQVVSDAVYAALATVSACVVPVSMDEAFIVIDSSQLLQQYLTHITSTSIPPLLASSLLSSSSSTSSSSSSPPLSSSSSLSTTTSSTNMLSSAINWACTLIRERVRYATSLVVGANLHHRSLDTLSAVSNLVNYVINHVNTLDHPSNSSTDSARPQPRGCDCSIGVGVSRLMARIATQFAKHTTDMNSWGPANGNSMDKTNNDPKVETKDRFNADLPHTTQPQGSITPPANEPSTNEALMLALNGGAIGGLGYVFVPQHCAAAVLREQRVDVLPGVGWAAHRKLKDKGIVRVKDLVTAGKRALTDVVGSGSWENLDPGGAEEEEQDGNDDNDSCPSSKERVGNKPIRISNSVKQTKRGRESRLMEKSQTLLSLYQGWERNHKGTSDPSSPHDNNAAITEVLGAHSRRQDTKASHRSPAIGAGSGEVGGAGSRPSMADSLLEFAVGIDRRGLNGVVAHEDVRYCLFRVNPSHPDQQVTTACPSFDAPSPTLPVSLPLSNSTKVQVPSAAHPHNATICYWTNEWEDNWTQAFPSLRKSIGVDVNYAVRVDTKTRALAFLCHVCEILACRLYRGRLGASRVTLKIMSRRPDQPVETFKYLGHGICDTTVKSAKIVGVGHEGVTYVDGVCYLTPGPTVASFAGTPSLLEGDTPPYQKGLAETLRCSELREERGGYPVSLQACIQQLSMNVIALYEKHLSHINVSDLRGIGVQCTSLIQIAHSGLPQSTHSKQTSFGKKRPANDGKVPRLNNLGVTQSSHNGMVTECGDSKVNLRKHHPTEVVIDFHTESPSVHHLPCRGQPVMPIPIPQTNAPMSALGMDQALDCNDQDLSPSSPLRSTHLTPLSTKDITSDNVCDLHLLPPLHLLDRATLRELPEDIRKELHDAYALKMSENTPLVGAVSSVTPKHKITPPSTACTYPSLSPIARPSSSTPQQRTGLEQAMPPTFPNPPVPSLSNHQPLPFIPYSAMNKLEPLPPSSVGSSLQYQDDNGIERTMVSTPFPRSFHSSSSSPSSSLLSEACVWSLAPTALEFTSMFQLAEHYFGPAILCVPTAVSSYLNDNGKGEVTGDDDSFPHPKRRRLAASEAVEEKEDGKNRASARSPIQILITEDTLFDNTHLPSALFFQIACETMPLSCDLSLESLKDLYLRVDGQLHTLIQVISREVGTLLDTSTTAEVDMAGQIVFSSIRTALFPFSSSSSSSSSLTSSSSPLSTSSSPSPLAAHRRHVLTRPTLRAISVLLGLLVRLHSLNSIHALDVLVQNWIQKADLALPLLDHGSSCITTPPSDIIHPHGVLSCDSRFIVQLMSLQRACQTALKWATQT